MKTDVVIDIVSRQTYAEGSDSSQLTTVGSMTRMNGKYYITYRESEMTGMEGVVTTLKVEGNDRVTLLRSGAQHSRLVLEKGQRHHCAYDVGFGALDIGVFAEQIQSDLSETGGSVRFRYTLDINSGMSSRNEVKITVREAGNQSCPM